MNIHRPPKWLRALYYSVDWKILDQPNSLYLTFDDGPTPEVTEWVLEQLDLFDAKATFFCIGRNVERFPQIYSKILEKGHGVGNHTYSHLKGWQTPTQEYLNDVELASQFIESPLFRPPYGRIKNRQIKKLKKMGYRMFMWDVLSEDYNAAINPEKCLGYLMKYTETGSIIVFHDSVKASKNLFAVLPTVLKYYKEKGFVFRELK
jgi:peptidoglycan/xylan/chitin deacetylase (PgdA/CDA1 family)